MKSSPSRITEAISAVWAAYQQRHSRCDAVPGHGHAALLARLTKRYSVDDLVAVIDWAHDCNSERARYLRDHDYLGLDNLYRQGKVDDRIAWARAWIAAGRPALPAPEPGNGTTPRRPPYTAIVAPKDAAAMLATINYDLRFHGEAELDSLPADFDEAAFFSLRRANRIRRKAGLPELDSLPADFDEETPCAPRP